MKVEGSVGFTPYNIEVTSLTAASAPANPSARPHIASRAPVFSTMRTMFGRPAPTIFAARAYEEAPVDDRPLRRGKRVRHPRYGYGVILTEEGSGEETRLTVYFDRAGKKKFVARYADLTPA